ncbi:hypothetical protein PsYK624_118090 [Phanerochaete sordida]|uniref:F-box domain-containing protein n=1 Tax=Phanerochaete sordida TaxID=48140 RepID=A0A9P3LI16_9APHY|nr:hypothetical protein PsYK624_118090 [Phanerochaete sordida]
MQTKLPVYLPAELVHAVVLRLSDRDAEDNRLKRGLAACSLICRHWARIIRPLLFLEIALRSAGDVEQLLAFLGHPDFLGRPLRDCIRMLSIVEHEDHTPKAVPWLHHILRLHRHFRFINVSLTMADTVTVDADQPEAQQTVSTLPFAWLPKILPASVGFIHTLTLRGLRVPSLRMLVGCIARLRVSELTLEALTFAKHDVEAVRARRTRHSTEFYLAVSRCFADAADDVPRWVRIADMLFAGQGYARLGDAACALVDAHVPLLLSFAGETGQVEHLNVRSVGSLDADPE